VVERWNQTIAGMARCMMKAKKMPVLFWGEAVNTSVFILNRLLMNSLIGVALFGAWHGRKPNVSLFQTFGCIGLHWVASHNIATQSWVLDSGASLHVISIKTQLMLNLGFWIQKLLSM
jgi:hypothetical protein